MGISQDNWHKHHKTGDKRKPYHKKRKYELGCPATNSKIGPHHMYTVQVHGGNKKCRALRLDVGNFSWGPEYYTRKTKIIDVVYNASNNELIRTKTLVKNCILLVDSTLHRQWYEPLYTLPLGCKKGAKLTPEDEEILNKNDQRKFRRNMMKGKRTPKSADFSRGSSNRRASCMHRFKTRPVRLSRWLCARGQGAGVLSEENQAQKCK